MQRHAELSQEDQAGGEACVLENLTSLFSTIITGSYNDNDGDSDNDNVYDIDGLITDRVAKMKFQK